MKRILLISVVLLAFFELSGYGQKEGRQVKVKPDTVSVDSVEYQLIVLDPGFESWLATKPSMNFYSKEYYEIKNRLYVLEWNYRYQHPLRYGNLYETRVDYEPNIDYGLELNYRLYYYFRYFEEVNHVRLIDYSR
jgi:hypothetical protein